MNNKNIYKKSDNNFIFLKVFLLFELGEKWNFGFKLFCMVVLFGKFEIQIV